MICSFGFLDPTKLNHRLLDAWLHSPLASDARCILVFVGKNHGGDYGKQLLKTIRANGLEKRIRITGYVDAPTFRNYLAAADMAVQLRTLSRGETSAAVLDCMNYSLPTIVNAHASMADLPAEAVWMLPDEFADAQLTEALTTLWRDSDRRRTLGQRAREVVHTQHEPRSCAEQYAQAIERYFHKASEGLQALVNALADAKPPLAKEDWTREAAALASDFSPRPRRKQLLVDISTLVQCDAKSGIQRVVRALLRHLLLNPPEGLAVEPVFATSDVPGYRYARQFTSRFLGVYDGWAEDAPVDAWQGDIFLALDLQPVVVVAQKDYLLGWHRRGIKVFFVVYDLLPISLPQACPDGARATHQRWLETISHFDGAFCISRAVADELHDWLQTFGPKREQPFTLNWFHLGADVENSMPTMGMPTDADQKLQMLKTRPSFLMVGTIEPRKGHAQTLAAFDLLWREGVDAHLVIVGKQGWMVEQLVEKLRSHPEFGKRLFWFEGISDEYLTKIYATSTCLIAASEGEGFGLPLIEAAQHNLPIIARDIPVFREVAGEHAYYFKGESPEQLAGAIKTWLSLDSSGNAPGVSGMKWLTWSESAEQLMQVLCKAKDRTIKCD